jgi:hypothetical protein
MTSLRASRFLALLVLSACSSSSSTAADADAGGAVDVPAETSDTASRADVDTSASSAKLVTELFVQEDPTIDVSSTIGQNADAVATQVKTATAGCTSATIAHTAGTPEVTVSFGTSCVINGNTLSGSVSAAVSGGSGTIAVTFTFTSLVVNSVSVNGTAKVTTSNGTTYASALDLTTTKMHMTFTGSLAADVTGKAITMNGSGTYLATGSSSTLAFTTAGLHHTIGACYADAGTLSFSKPSGRATVTETITFGSTTPSTGQAQITVGGKTSTTTLPAYGTCPHA